MAEEQLVTVADACDRLSLSRSQFTRWRKAHNIPAYRFGASRGVRFKWSDIERAVEACIEPPADDGERA